jgi:YihY family inner membrane protein
MEQDASEDKAAENLGARLKKRFRGLESRSPWLGALAAAGRGFSRDELKLPSVYFAYNCFLAIFPLLLLVSAVLGFVLAGHQPLYTRVMREILTRFPGASTTLKDLVNSVIANRALVGIIGFIGLLWAGTRIPVGLEAGFNRIWKHDKRPFFRQRLFALGVLIAVGALAAISVGASLLTSSLLSWTVKNATGVVVVLVFLLGLVVSLLTNFSIFFLVYRAIPHVKLSARSISIGAAVGALMFWVSEYVFNWYFTAISKLQVLYGTIGALLGLLIWLHILGYIVFFCAELVALRNAAAEALLTE